MASTDFRRALLGMHRRVRVDSDGVSPRFPLASTRVVSASQPYMAPEIISGVAYGSKVDIWAAGVVTFEMLHGTFPFR